MRRPGWMSLYVVGLVVVLGAWLVATHVHGWIVIPLVILMFAVLFAIRVDQFDRLDQHLLPWLRRRR